METFAADSSNGVATRVFTTARGTVVYMVDTNEKDPHVGSRVRMEAARFLDRSEHQESELAHVITALDKHLLVDVSGRQGVKGAAASVFLGLIAPPFLQLAFVGEIRTHVLDAMGRVVFATHEHNVFCSYPESVWRGKYSEHEAQQTILGVVGGGNAIVESRLIPQMDSGSLIVMSHQVHRHRAIQTYAADLSRMVADYSRPATKSAEGLTVVSW